jgi:hypothetical protein
MTTDCLFLVIMIRLVLIFLDSADLCCGQPPQFHSPIRINLQASCLQRFQRRQLDVSVRTANAHRSTCSTGSARLVVCPRPPTGDSELNGSSRII